MAYKPSSLFTIISILVVSLSFFVNAQERLEQQEEIETSITKTCPGSSNFGGTLITIDAVNAGSSVTACAGDITATNGSVISGNTDAAATASNVHFQKSRSSGVITSGDALGTMTFQGHDGTSYIISSQVKSVSSGTIATNRVASDLEFFTHPNSTTASTQRMTINSAGNVTVNTPDSGTAVIINGGGVTSTGTTTLSSLAAGIVAANSSGVLSSSATTNHTLQIGNSSSTLTSLGVATNGQLPIGSTGADPVLSTLTAGTNMSVTNGAGSITIATAIPYAYAYNTGAQTVAANGVTNFSTIGPSSTGITPPSAGGSTFTITNDGTYLFDLYANGDAGTQLLVFDLIDGNNTLITGTRFISQDQAGALDPQNHTVNGSCIATITAGTTIRLHNFTNAGGTAVVLNNTAATAANASLRIMRVG